MLNANDNLERSNQPKSDNLIILNEIKSYA